MFLKLSITIKGPFSPGLCSFTIVLQGKYRALSLQLLLSQLSQLSGFPPFQLLLEDEQVNIDNVVQHGRGTEESTMQSACYPTAEHILAWNKHTYTHCKPAG